MTTRAEIQEFLAQKRLAIVGVSRNPDDFSRRLYNEFVARGYEVAAVNPNADVIEGKPCWRHVQDITPPVENVLIMTPPAVTEQVAHDCAEAHVSRVWMHRGEGIGAVSQPAVAYCEQHGMSVVAGYCPFMFLPNAPWFHGAHGFMLKVMRKYPH